MFSKLFLILNIFCCTVFCDESAIVEISNGKLQGSFNGHYYSFKGIPYAEPTVGENRFESPKPFLTKWNDIRDATKSGEVCISLDPVTKIHDVVIIGSEDCLFINVYTPKIKTDNLLPVIFFIHGGGFMYGSGDFHKETLVMNKENMVLVTFNYRLGPLGFMNTGDGEITGNMGLKDQRLALKWVHENINLFGGDPEHVLMTGFSAGGASVEYHLLQPEIEKYISAAYSLSGTALNSWAFHNDVPKNVKKIANILKCSNTESTTEIKKCLKNIPANDILGAAKELFTYTYNSLVVWGPSIESADSKDPMVLEAPRELIKKGKAANVPYLSSHTTSDGGYIVAELLYQKSDGTSDIEYFSEKYEDIMPTMLFYQNKFEDKVELNKYTKKLYDKIRRYYKIIDENNFDQLIEYLTDDFLALEIRESWNLHSQYSSLPMYCYVYDYPASVGLANMISNRYDFNFGCGHGDDVLLMFNHPLRDTEKFNDIEKEHSKNFLNLLEDFARTGVPKFRDRQFPANANTSDDEVTFLQINDDSINAVYSLNLQMRKMY